MYIFDWIRSRVVQIADIQSRIHKIQEALGRIEGRQVALESSESIASKQYQVFSQWGEDGIIQSLLRVVNVKNKVFIEFGVQNFCESNTRFLLVNNNWSGLLIDASVKNIEYIKNDPIFWRHNLKAECCFITAENIDNIFLKNGITGEIGMLSIDIDGNDYWVWRAISVISPAIVVVEYNARFGNVRSVTVPYEAKFTRESAHFSNIYYGASLAALCKLAQVKGYAFVGANLAGNNAFFVRRDLMTSGLKELPISQGYVQNQFRESRSEAGELTFLTHEQEYELLNTLPLVEVDGSLAQKASDLQ